MPTLTTTPAPPAMPTLRAKSDPRTEYVAGGGYGWLATYLRTLPQPVDDITQDFGDDLYERMMFDPQVSSCINTLKNQILANRVSLPCARQEEDEDFAQAQEIAAFCDRTLANLDTPLFDVMWNLLDALAYGHKVAEKVYGDGENEDKGKLVLKRIRVKPRRVTAFVVDAFQNVVGLLGIIPGVSWSLLASSFFVGDPQSVPNLLPRDKFVVLTCRETDSDPRGRSLLRPAWNAWFLKTQVWPEYLKYLMQFASPAIIGTTAAESFGTIAATNADGTARLDGNDNPIYLTPQQAMLQDLLAFRNSAAMVVPNGATVTPLETSGEGGAFTTAIDLFNREIDRAITGQTLATGEAQHDTRAASQTHQDVLGNAAAYGRSLLETVLFRDVLTQLVEVNYGRAAVPLTPWPTLSDIEQQDFSAQAEAVAALQTSGYLVDSQKPELDAKMGLPKRSEVETTPAAQNTPPETQGGPETGASGSRGQSDTPSATDEAAPKS